MEHNLKATIEYNCRWALKHAVEGEAASFALGNICMKLHALINECEAEPMISAYRYSLAIVLHAMIDNHVGSAIGLIADDSDSFATYHAACAEEFTQLSHDEIAEGETEEAANIEEYARNK